MLDIYGASYYVIHEASSYLVCSCWHIIWTKRNVFGFVYEIDGHLVSIYYRGTVERDRYGYVEFVDRQSMPVLFNEKPSFSELVSRAREELHCHGADDDDGIAVEGVLHLVSETKTRVPKEEELITINIDSSKRSRA